ncbi:MAG TPA: four helix bundle protein [Vicinamibacterales bacterium]|nr:four helix bundle protein [Vicinamibacterales bacterium]
MALPLQSCHGMSEIAEELRQRTFRYFLRILSFCRQRLPDIWDCREIGRQLLRAGMGVSGNYWSACRGRSTDEFITKLGVATDEADESVLWMTAVIQSGINQDSETKDLLREGQELRAILSKSHKTAKENRLRKKRAAREARNGRQIINSSTRQLTKSTGGLP